VSTWSWQAWLDGQARAGCGGNQVRSAGQPPPPRSNPAAAMEGGKGCHLLRVAILVGGERESDIGATQKKHA